MLFSDIFNPCSYIPDSETKICLRLNGRYVFFQRFIYIIHVQYVHEKK